jgi:hypothetical protein
VSDVPHLAITRRTAALAAAVGLALATAGCGAGSEPTTSGTAAEGTTTTTAEGGTEGTAEGTADRTAEGDTEGSAEPRAAVSGGPAELPTFDPSSSVATYAEGFPPDLFPMPEGATLLASSASPVPAAKDSKAKGVPMTQVTLNLASSHPTRKVVGQVKKTLVDQGFEQIDAPETSGLTAQTAFLRVTSTKSGEVQESLVVGVLDDGERRLASISGTVRTP